MRTRTNLFDTRGGLTMMNRCEECHDEISDDSMSGLCRDCEDHYVPFEEQE